MRVAGLNEINPMESTHEFSEIAVIPKSRNDATKEPPKGLTN